MKKSSKNIVKIWVTKADHDLGSAKIIFQHIPDYFDTIAFHCQQAVEKYIKAALVHYDINFQRTHDLLYLLDLLSEKVLIKSELFDKAILLNGFGVEIRYHNQVITLTNDELKEAISIADEFREFITKLVAF